MARNPQITEAHFIKEWRKARGLTQVALAERAGVSHATISRVETFTTAYHQDLLEAVAEALDCSASDLLVGPPGTASDTIKKIQSADPATRERIMALAETMLTFEHQPPDPKK